MNPLLAIGLIGTPELIVIGLLLFLAPLGAALLVAFIISRMIRTNKASTPLPMPPLPPTQQPEQAPKV
jgi:hypothetical protein